MSTEERHWIKRPLPITLISLLLLVSFLAISSTLFPVKTLTEPSISNPEPSPSQDPISSCVDVREKKWFLEEEERNERNKKLKEIYSLQRNYLIRTANTLFEQGELSSQDLKVLQELVTYSRTEQIPLAPFDRRYKEGERVIKSLLNKGLIRGRLVQRAQKEGMALTISATKSQELVLGRPECFEEFEVNLLKKFRDPSVKTTKIWTQRKSASDLVQIMASTLR